MGQDKFLQIPIDMRFKNVGQLLETQDGRIFINLLEHLCEYLPETGELKVSIEDFNPDDAYINTCYIDANNQLWSLTSNHLRHFNTSTFECLETWALNAIPDTLHEILTIINQQHDISFRDSKDNLWMALHNHGFQQVRNEQGRFGGMTDLKNPLKDKAIISISTAKDGNVWICTEENEVFIWDNNILKKVNVTKITGSASSEEQQIVVLADDMNRLWAVMNGLLTECRYDKGELTPLHQHSEITADVHSIQSDANGTIWVGTATNRLYYLYKGQQLFNPLSIDASALFISYQLASLRNGDLILGTALNNPIYLNPKTGEQYRIPIAEDFTDYSLTTAIQEDKEGNIWIGTHGIGAYRYEPANHRVTRISGLPCEEVSALVIDQDGDAWISTLNGLSRVSSKYLTVTNYSTADGIEGNQFNVNCGTMLPDGELLFGGMHGLTTVNTQIRQEPHFAPLYFERLTINNQPMRLNPNQTLRLNHDDSNFSLSFAFLDYSGLEQTHHFYRLEGFNNQWIDINVSREIFLSNIPAGHYRLQIRATDHDQQIVLAESALDIQIAPAWWNSWWAWLCYLLFVGSYIVVLILHMRNRKRIRELLSQVTKVDERVEEVLNTQDKQFMDELFAIMQEDLSDTELNINSLAERLLMSRSKLNYKIKGLTGETPAAFFKRFKLNKAAELLRAGNHNISEVADLTGFSSPTVFTRNFKQQFGVTPSEYISKP
ncbi:MAG: AraC family transcriptional regulator [Bacteroidales bacterium]